MGHKTQVALAILGLFTLHIAILLLLALFANSYETPLFAAMIIHLAAVGLTQWLYVVPLALWLRHKKRTPLLQGVLIAAGLTLLGNGLCTVLMRFSFS
jgi:hypothetical protein